MLGKRSKRGKKRRNRTGTRRLRSFIVPFHHGSTPARFLEAISLRR
jgi:hypothetical protein